MVNEVNDAGANLDDLAQHVLSETGRYVGWCAVKVPINQVACISLDAPTLPAEQVVIEGVTRWRVWCRHCGAWHYHGPAEGHREVHCQDSSSPYWRSGYNLALAQDDTDEDAP